MGVECGNGYCHLANGAVVPHHLASSAVARYRRRILEPRCPSWNLRNSDGRQHRLSLARISQLCRLDSFCWLLADRFLGGPIFSVSSLRSDLLHAMVSSRLVFLVPLG